MSQQDFYHLLEHILSFLGSECQLVGGLLLRNGSISFKSLSQKIQQKMPSIDEKEANELVKNTVAILIKHNLVKAWESKFDQITYYSFDDRECVLRLSMPRYLMKLRSQFSPLYQSILEQILIHGSLQKSEIMAMLENNQESKHQIQVAIDELIQANYIVGANSYLTLDKSNGKPTHTAKSKRQAKEDDKKAAKEQKMIKNENVIEHDSPLKINSLKFLAEERRQCLIDFARTKFLNSHSPGSDVDLKILAFLIQKEQNINKQVINEGSTKKDVQSTTFTWQNVQSDYHLQERKELTEKDIVASLERLFNDPVQFIRKVGLDHKHQAPIYTVNWEGILQQFQEQMMIRIVEETMSKYHARIIRILKAKGFLEEKDILNFCVHDFKATQSFINQLLTESFIQSQEVQVKGQSQPLIFYGLNIKTWRQKLTYRIAKSCFNIVTRDDGTLNAKAMLSFELNNLYF